MVSTLWLPFDRPLICNFFVASKMIYLLKVVFCATSQRLLFLIWLVVSNMVFICPFHTWNNPSHWLIFFRGVGQPPTSNTWGYMGGWFTPTFAYCEDECLNLNHMFFVFALTPSDPPWIGVTVPWRAEIGNSPWKMRRDFPGGKIMELLLLGDFPTNHGADYRRVSDLTGQSQKWPRKDQWITRNDD